ncbi:MAG: Stp1/IreP family PP2C-type Ser/Thr phosphatase [Chloroflexi bacterium]|nr:Stp1/IreP family PP2C-type Ser/Thr phosphatase [Chloroflexota bacterium]
MQFLRGLLGLDKDPCQEVQPSIRTDGIGGPRLLVGWVTDVGSMRHHNEDALLVLTSCYGGEQAPPDFDFFVVADGMGGHRAGEVASSVAVRTVTEHVTRHFYLPNLIGEERGVDQPCVSEVLVEAVQAANDAVTTQVPGGGTTLTCVLILGGQAYVAHVGDSRAYIIQDGTADQITQDHSLVDRLVELGQLTRDEAAVHPQKNVLYRALGQAGNLQVDYYVRTIPDSGHLLICTDGLWGMVSLSEIAHIVASCRNPQTACGRLMDAANRAGGRDNITAILVSYAPS